MAQRLNCTAQEYYDHPAVSNSMLKVYRESPSLYYGRFITKTIQPRKETEASRIGSLAHMCVLEPDRWTKVVSLPKVDMRTKVGKETMEKFLADQSPDSITANSWEKYVAENCAQAVLKNPVAKKLLARGVGETPITWDCDHTNMELKALIDFWTDSGELIDLKFLNDPTPQWWHTYTCRDRGYHTQAAHYQEGASKFTFCDPEEIPFTFICCGSEAPHDVYCIQLDRELLDTARETLFLLKKRLEYSMINGDWMPPESRVVHRPEKFLWGHDEDVANEKTRKFLGLK